MKKIILLIALFISISCVVTWAQEIPIFNQYLLNRYLHNPSETGRCACSKFRLTHRQQWLGVDQAPRTSTASYHGRVSNSKVGLGIMAYNDRNGLVSSTGGSVSLGYHIPFGDSEGCKRQLSFGVSANIFQHTIDESGFQIFAADGSQAMVINDPAISGIKEGFFSYNANFGVTFSWDGLTAGLSALQLLSPANDYFNYDYEPKIPKYIISEVSYKLEIEDWGIEPGVLFRTARLDGNMDNKQIHINVTGSRKLDGGSVWLTLSSRNSLDDGFSALSIMPLIGFKSEKGFNIAACYDLFLSDVKEYYSNPTFEVMIGFDICKKGISSCPVYQTPLDRIKNRQSR